CSKAIKLLEKLVQDDPQDEGHNTLLAYTLSFASRAYEANGRNDQAVAVVGKAHAIWAKLAQKSDRALQFRIEAADCQNRLGDLNSKAGRREQAETAYKTSLKIRKGLPAQETSKAPQQQALADTYGSLGHLYAGAIRFQEAEAAHTK